MHSSRRLRLIATLVALFSLLFMQLAVASFACPIPASTMQSAASAPQAMPGCVEMETMQPSLCHAHEQAGNQSLDRPDLPQVPPFAPTGVALTLLPLIPRLPESIVRASDVADLRANAPPIAIRNCCFRI